MAKMILLSGLLLVAACRSGGAKWNNADALAAQKLEVQVDGKGHYTEVEYHVSPDVVPQAVRAAMDKLHPGGAFTDAEKEWNEGKLYWELSRKVSGLEVEAMFEPDGTLFQEEIEVPANKVPPAVQDAVSRRLAGAKTHKWEEIRDAKRNLVEYHAKAKRGNHSYKVMVGTNAKVTGVVREIPAEIEVPE